MEQTTLFRGALAALTVSAHYKLGPGWMLRVAVRYEGEEWKPEDRRDFYGLTSDEMEQALWGSLEAVLAEG